MTLDLSAIGARIEAMLSEQLSLAPTVLPPDLARMQGSWKGAPVTLHTHAYSGPRIRYARVARIDGSGLVILNVLALSRPEWPLPILGMDVVCIGSSTVVVADLSPASIDAATRARQQEIFSQRRRAHALLPSAGVLPAWCDGWFSRDALFARIGSAAVAETAAQLADIVDAFGEIARSTAADTHQAAAIEARQRAYCAVHLSEDRGLQLTRKMFDPALADRFLREVLFPEGEPACL